MNTEEVRLCEYQCCTVTWGAETRNAVAAAAESWAQAHGLPKPPLQFEGSDGCTLRAQQFVGVVEAGGVRVQIYPKLDAALLADGQLTEDRTRSVMSNLLWLLEQSGYDGLIDAGDASVEECPESMTDLLAWLYARRLQRQLQAGVPQDYIGHRDDLPLVRGSIQFARQATTLFARPDVIACAWDEFSADTPLARLLRCATEVLLSRVRLPGAAADLRDALALLEDAASVHQLEALSGAASIRWSRQNVRWRSCHDIALAVLRGLGRDLHAGGADSFVFLINMNALFECHCARWLEQRFNARVEEQVRLGTLLVSPERKLGQDADFLWHHENAVWVGDAKYKRDSGDWPKIDDVRQLICYGQLAQRRHTGRGSKLMLLYPTTGAESETTGCTFDGQPLKLQAIRVVRED